MSELYNKDILRLAISIPLSARLTAPDVTVVRTSRICGSRVTADFIFASGAISEYGQEVKACALGQASCSIFGRHIIGQTRETMAPVVDAMRHMLAGDGPPPVDEWAELEIFLPAREHKSRHGSIMLPFEAALEAFDSLAEKSD
jgi:NifU-like protein involved in Fe-S cluster formation